MVEPATTPEAALMDWPGCFIRRCGDRYCIQPLPADDAGYLLVEIKSPPDGCGRDCNASPRFVTGP